MKLNYKVLWIDDRHDAVVPIQESITSYLVDLGFHLEVVWKKNGTGIHSLAGDPDLDLIVMDQNLGGTPGDRLIKTIRQREKFIEIILYSQDPQVNLQDKDAGIDGIYRTARSDLETILKRVVGRTIRKTQDLNVMRGLVIAETIDIENQVEQIMTQAFEDKGQFFQEKVLESHVYDFGKKYDFLVRMMKDLLSDPSNQQRDLKDKNTEELSSLQRVLKKMDREVLDIRNILAHSKVEYDEQGKACLRGLNKRTKSITPDEAWCRSTRKTLLKHEKNLAEIHDLYRAGKSRVVPKKHK
jgi:CheY-like chemotaxis protein